MDAPSSSSRRALRSAGDRLIAVIFADEQLSEAVAEVVIDRKVAAGELVRAESLMVGPGLALHPAGLVQRLEAAIDDALDALDDGSPSRATAILEATLPEPAAPPQAEPIDEDEDPDSDSEPQPQVAAVEDLPARRRRARPEGEEAPPPPPGRPAGFPDIDGEYECASVDTEGVVCGDKISGKQAQLSVTRFRVRLCRDCMEVYDPLEAGMVAVG